MAPTQQHNRGQEPVLGGGVIIQDVGYQTVGHQLEVKGYDGDEAGDRVQPSELEAVLWLGHVLDPLKKVK